MHPKFDQFLADVQLKAFHTARYSLGDRELAMDIVQDTMERMIKNYSDKPEQEWPGLFYSILSNRIRDEIRKSKFKNLFVQFSSHFNQSNEADVEETNFQDYPDSRSATPEKLLECSQLMQKIKSALLQLPERQRQVFMLREQMQYTVSECAEILGCTDGTIKQHHYRAMRKLQDKLREILL